jgi:hypothetical protein
VSKIIRFMPCFTGRTPNIAQFGPSWVTAQVVAAQAVRNIALLPRRSVLWTKLGKNGHRRLDMRFGSA